MIHCIFEERIEKENGQLVRITNARWNTKKYGSGNIDVFKIYEDGKRLCRNLSYCILGGYYLYSTEPDEWSEPIIGCKIFNLGFNNFVIPSEIELVKEKYPNFRYMLDKVIGGERGITIAKLWKYLKAWKLWPECERLINAGYEKLALSESFAKAPYIKQKQMIEYLKNHKEVIDPSFGELQYLIKNKCSQQDYKIMKILKLSKKQLKYYSRQMSDDKEIDVENVKAIHNLYKDYMRMVENVGHNADDDYWKYPNDLRTAHNKVMKEQEQIEINKQRKKEKDYIKAVKNFIDKIEKNENMIAYVPKKIEDICYQAEYLHQCLIYADYIDKVIQRNCLLVFIKLNEKPLATAELDRNGKVIQFYGDESSHTQEEMNPSKDAEILLNKWIESFKPKFYKTRRVA